MCGRFTLTSSGETLAAHFETGEVPVLEPRYNIAPTQPVAAVTWGPAASGARGADRGDRQGTRSWRSFRWGLVPAWARDVAIGSRLINARGETVAEKPAYRDAFRRHRCLVAADGFYEWSAGRGGRRRPHWFRLRSGAPFAIAGLWERWSPRGVDGEAIESCTLVTSEANASVRPYHDRMPVILSPRDYAAWLDPGTEVAALLALLVPCPPDWLSATAVGTAVNDPRHEGPDCVEPLEPVEADGSRPRGSPP